MVDIFTSSDKFKSSLVEPKKPRGKGLKYPWLGLKQGESFAVLFSDLKYESLVSMAYRTGKRHNREFKVIKHPERGVYEVGLVRDLNNPEPPRNNPGWVQPPGQLPPNPANVEAPQEQLLSAWDRSRMEGKT